LPKNYQISQYKKPLGEAGFLEITTGERIGINRLHLEEDAGKLIHKQNYSLIDFNRTGTPLMEIVSEPEIKSPQEAFEYLTDLKLLLEYIGVSDCDMEKGSLRCDANISLGKGGQLGTKVELKNMNTFKGIRAALEYEAERQYELLNQDKQIVQETRLWDEDKLKTITMRSKERAHDYRYFPEPDLLDFSVSADILKSQQAAVGELPAAKRKRFSKDYSLLTTMEANILIDHPKLAEFFEATVKIYPKVKEISNWLIGPFLEQVNSLEGGFPAVKISPANFAKVVKYFSQGKMNNLAAKKALSLSIASDEDIDEIINREQLIQVSDEKELDKFIEEVVSQNNQAVEEYLGGKAEAIQFLVGQVMKKTKGKANPKIAREMLERRLKQ